MVFGSGSTVEAGRLPSLEAVIPMRILMPAPTAIPISPEKFAMKENYEPNPSPSPVAPSPTLDASMRLMASLPSPPVPPWNYSKVMALFPSPFKPVRKTSLPTNPWWATSPDRPCSKPVFLKAGKSTSPDPMLMPVDPFEPLAPECWLILICPNRRRSQCGN